MFYFFSIFILKYFYLDCSDASQRQDFLKEIELMKSIGRHSNVVRHTRDVTPTHVWHVMFASTYFDRQWSPFGSLWSVKQTVTSLAFKSCCSTREHIGFVATMRSFIIIDRSQSSLIYFEVNYSRCSLVGQHDWLLLQVVAPRPHRRAPATWRPATLPTQAQTEHGPG